MKGFPVILLLIAVLFFSGCTGGNQKAASTPPPVITEIPTTLETPAVVLTTTIPTQEYKTVNLVISAPNTYPVYGFTMDYPADWSYKQEHSKTWRAGYNFSGPDGGANVYVYVDDTSGSAFYWYNLSKWADNIVGSMSLAYCHDSNGRPMTCAPERNARDYYHAILISSEPYTIPGAFEARKMVFGSNDDRYYGKKTLYIMHAGAMQLYNFTVPDHYEVGKPVSGPAYSYGVGGQGYIIDFIAPSDHVAATSEIYEHMIKSLKVNTN